MDLELRPLTFRLLLGACGSLPSLQILESPHEPLVSDGDRVLAAPIVALSPAVTTNSGKCTPGPRLVSQTPLIRWALVLSRGPNSHGLSMA